MAINIFTDQMQHAELFGKPVLTTNWLIPRETVPDGWWCYDMQGTDRDPAAHAALVDQVYETAIRASAQVYEYTVAMASAPRLEADGLRDNFRLLASFNGIVLAGREMEGGLGYEFTTWRRDGNGTGVAHGNYYHNDYDGAKLDFACRSGLVQESRQFSDEQLTEIYRCIYETMDSEYPISEERRAMLTAAAEQIERCVDDLAERVGLSNQRELEAAEQQAESGPAMEMAP